MEKVVSLINQILTVPKERRILELYLGIFSKNLKSNYL
jgi:hypothetical protein